MERFLYPCRKLCSYEILKFLMILIKIHDWMQANMGQTDMWFTHGRGLHISPVYTELDPKLLLWKWKDFWAWMKLGAPLEGISELLFSSLALIHCNTPPKLIWSSADFPEQWGPKWNGVINTFSLSGGIKFVEFHSCN